MIAAPVWARVPRQALIETSDLAHSRLSI